MDDHANPRALEELSRWVPLSLRGNGSVPVHFPSSLVLQRVERQSSLLRVPVAASPSHPNGFGGEPRFCSGSVASSSGTP